jgi:hypothetical protein
MFPVLLVSLLAVDVRVRVTGRHHGVCPLVVARHFADLDGVDVAYVRADAPFVDDVRVTVDAVCADGRQVTCHARDVLLERACATARAQTVRRVCRRE